MMLETQAHIPRPATILKTALMERVHHNPSYSLRAFARDLKISHNYLSQVLNESRTLSVRTAMRLCTALRLGEAERTAFLAGLAEAPATSKRKKPEAESTGILLEMDRFKLVSEWYHGAIVELVAMNRPGTTASSMARALGLSLKACRNAIARLERLGILEPTRAGWCVTEAHFFAPAIKPELAVQKFHSQMLEKAERTMREKNSPDDYRGRDITGLTLAIDPARMDKAKAEIAAFRRRMKKLLARGDKSKVYHLAVQLFPLTSILLCLFFAACSGGSHSTDLPSPKRPSGWEVGAGGDAVRMTFAKGRRLALDMTREYKTLKDTASPEIDRWIREHRVALLDDVTASEHRWTNDPVDHDAMTELKIHAPILFSLPYCRAIYETPAEAAELLLHESAHHLGVRDEGEANAIAIALGTAFHIARGIAAGDGSWSELVMPTEYREPYRWGGGKLSAFTGSEIFVWGGAVYDPTTLESPSGEKLHGYLFDPVNRNWRRIENTGQPEWTYGGSAAWTGSEVVVWGGHSLASDRHYVDKGAAYDPNRDRWRPIEAPSYLHFYEAPKLLAVGNAVIFWSWRESRAIFFPRTGEWRKIAPKEICDIAVECRLLASDDGKLVVVGTTSPDKAGAIYDIASDRWQDIPNLVVKTGSDGWKVTRYAVPPNHPISPVISGHRLFVFTNGSSIGPQASLYDLKQGSWEFLPNDKFTPQPATDDDYEAFARNEKIFLVGGTKSQFAVHYYDLRRRKWGIKSFVGSEPTVPRLDPSRFPHFANYTPFVWTGESLFVFFNELTQMSEYGLEAPKLDARKIGLIIEP